jgi:hypothetical protein
MLKNLSVHQVFIVIHLLSALLTVIPRAGASKACRLGYKALCSFTPYGTLILLALAGLHLYLHLKATAAESMLHQEPS